MEWTDQHIDILIGILVNASHCEVDFAYGLEYIVEETTITLEKLKERYISPCPDKEFGEQSWKEIMDEYN